MSDGLKTKKYEKGDSRVVWTPHLCYHSKKCFHGLPEVFNPDQRPWVQVENASLDTIIAQVEKCPSGALTMERKGEEESKQENNDKMVEINVVPNGPLILEGKVHIKTAEGQPDFDGEKAALCRCGASAKKPFCDGSHKGIEFKAE